MATPEKKSPMVFCMATPSKPATSPVEINTAPVSSCRISLSTTSSVML